MPQRIQRKRTKGWSLPPDTICVTRPGPWGNPFTVTGNIAPGTQFAFGRYFAVGTLEESLSLFRQMVEENPDQFPDLEDIRGKNLACWCKLGDPCHADILLEIANK